MLIRHFLIPKHSRLQPLKEPTQQAILDQSRQYHNFLTPTLNPEQPIHDVLAMVTDRQEIGVRSLPCDASNTQQFLVREYPQVWQDFVNVERQSQQQSQSTIRESVSPPGPQQKSPIQQQEKNKQGLSNQVYLSGFKGEREKNSFSSLQTMTNKHYLIKNSQTPIGIFEEQSETGPDEALVNNHSFRIKARNGKVYRTLEKLRSHRAPFEKEEKIDRKYNLTLPKQSRSQKGERQFMKTKDPEQYLPSKMAPIGQFNHRKDVCLPTKKRQMPSEEDEQMQPIFILKSSQKRPRRTLQQESIINRQVSGEMALKNKDTQRGKEDFQNNSPFAIRISYRVPLSRLREICSIPNLNSCDVQIRIPEIFSLPLFSGSQSQEELFRKAAQLTKHLQLDARSQISLKKYTNCLLVIIAGIAVVWHYSGKIYLGGWEHQVLDQGCKQGVGLEWLPHLYVYYGQFNRNKREGVGILKNSDGQVLAGIWRENKYLTSMRAQLRD